MYIYIYTRIYTYIYIYATLKCKFFTICEVTLENMGNIGAMWSGDPLKSEYDPS